MNKLDIINKSLELYPESSDTMRLQEQIIKDLQDKSFISIENELSRMFPRLKGIRDSVSRTERYYWNDGSENGLLLITFFEDDDLDFQTNKFSIGFKYA